MYVKHEFSLIVNLNNNLGDMVYFTDLLVDEKLTRVFAVQTETVL